MTRVAREMYVLVAMSSLHGTSICTCYRYTRASMSSVDKTHTKWDRIATYAWISAASSNLIENFTTKMKYTGIKTKTSIKIRKSSTGAASLPTQ